MGETTTGVQRRPASGSEHRHGRGHVSRPGASVTGGTATDRDERPAPAPAPAPASTATAAATATATATASTLPGLRTRPRPRRVLVLVDTIAVLGALLATGAVLLWLGRTELSLEHLAAPFAVALAAPPTMIGLKLYVRAANRIASTEMTRIARVASILAGVVLGAYAVLGRSGALTPAVLVGTTLFLSLSVGRQVFRDYLRAQRRHGVLGYPTVVVGNGPGTASLVAMLQDHPDLGFEPTGVLTTVAGPPPGLAATGVPHLGRLLSGSAADEIGDALGGAAGVSGAIVVASSMGGSELNDVVHRLLGRGMHVHVVHGLTGIASQRMFADPLLTDSAFYVAPEPPAGVQPALKRIGDVVLSCLALLVFGPVMAVVALAIRLDGRGPILFRQERVGQDGERFRVLKFRTMVPDAESRLADLMEDNVRNGPLFKVARDPRVTRVGAVLRKTSLDELPQLFNVIGGSMSLVGPRPALPVEVAQFDDELLERLTVKPGITGLWQVEARDEASFDLYRRYDLFYVRNWTVLLDLVILFRTAIVVGLRPVLARGGRRFGGRSVEAAAVLD